MGERQPGRTTAVGCTSSMCTLASMRCLSLAYSSTTYVDRGTKDPKVLGGVVRCNGTPGMYPSTQCCSTETHTPFNLLVFCIIIIFVLFCDNSSECALMREYVRSGVDYLSTCTHTYVHLTSKPWDIVRSSLIRTGSPAPDPTGVKKIRIELANIKIK